MKNLSILTVMALLIAVECATLGQRAAFHALKRRQRENQWDRHHYENTRFWKPEENKADDTFNNDWQNQLYDILMDESGSHYFVQRGARNPGAYLNQYSSKFLGKGRYLNR